MKTNQQAKQEAIKKAYGDLYEPNEHHINEDGLIHYISEPNLVGLNIYGDKFHSNGSGSFVLKELWDIQNNNGWIRIEPDGSNLPKNRVECWFKDKNQEVPICGVFLNDKESIDYVLANATHYQIVETPKPPIY